MNIEAPWIGKDKDEKLVEYTTCDWCGESIYVGDHYYDIDDTIICEDCIKNCRRTA